MTQMKQEQEIMGMVTDIQRFSVHDGPGIRTTVSLKGCNMDCAWCHNPETVSFEPEMIVDESKCIGCGKCAEVCPQKCITPGTPHHISWEHCLQCGRCAEACPADAVRRLHP